MFFPTGFSSDGLSGFPSRHPNQPEQTRAEEVDCGGEWDCVYRYVV
jgi:hypothetical protein